jgi:hypothetical protein
VTRALGAILVGALIVGCAARPAAQQMNLGIGVTVGSSWQGAGDSDIPYLGPSFSGAALDAVVFLDAGGTFFRWGGEASFAGDISGAQTARASPGTNTFVSKHHDTILSGTITLTTPRDRQLHVAAAGGFGAAFRRTDRQGATRNDGAPFTSTTTPFQETVSSVVPAATGGVDATVALTRHLGLLAVGRVHYLFDDDRRPDGVVNRGVSSVIIRWGVGGLIRF